MRFPKVTINLLLLTILSVFLSGCFEPKKENVSSSGVALKGYDPVSFFNYQPLKGLDSIVYKNKEGITYKFATEGNKTKFIGNPEKYTPQLGGWCAYAMVDDVVITVKPRCYRIINGHLYFFYSESMLNRWDQRTANTKGGVTTLVSEAQANWKKKLKG